MFRLFPLSIYQDYFPSFISLSEYLLTCKEQKAREFGVRVYTSLFKEFADSYSRQEVSSFENRFFIILLKSNN